jgi:hypothetical protein
VWKRNRGIFRKFKSQSDDGMIIRPEDYLPIEVIFNIVCIFQRGFSGSQRALRNVINRRGLYFGNYQDLPKLSIWLQLCRAASLIDDAWPTCPTLYVNDWLACSLEKQIWTLMHAWISVPRKQRNRRLRERLIQKLNVGAPLSITYQRELPGLRATRICEGDRLSPLGQTVVNGLFEDCSSISSTKPWTVKGDQLYVPFPPKWDLLWQLEKYLDPLEPGIYSLSPESLRMAVQRDGYEGTTIPNLITILESGLGKPIPSRINRAWNGTPWLRILPGPVLEFSDTQELHKLRESSFFRQYLSGIISPRHIHLDPWQAPAILQRLLRRGLLDSKDLEMIIGRHPGCSVGSESGSNERKEKFVSAFEPNEESKSRKDCLSKAERTFLLSLLLMGKGLGENHAPPGLITKLTTGLDSSCRAAAARRAAEYLEQIFPKPVIVREEDPPPQPEQEILNLLEQAISHQETVYVRYRAFGRTTPEMRCLTPLLLEKRGPRFYLIAYCHTRRANRTFRLDRLCLADPV